MFRVGAYKSAVGAVLRTDMSPEAREEETSVYLNSLWATYQNATTTARKLEADARGELRRDVRGPGRGARAAHAAAEVALKAGLVTGIKSRLDVEKRVISIVGEDEKDGLVQRPSITSITSRVVHAEKKRRPGGHAEDRRRRRGGRDSRRRPAAGHDRRRFDGAAHSRGAAGRRREGRRAARG